MKKIIILFAMAFSIMSCENQPNDFPDFEAQTVYFPIQYPIRTLALGESRSDNSIDLEHAFSVGVAIGGMYENKEDRVVDIALAPELVTGVTANGLPLQILPSNYYEAVDFSKITIPAGSFSGKLKVKLTDAFFNDPLSTGLNYVIPLKILTSTKDSVLSGTPLPEIGAAADRRKVDQWMPGFTPKDYTLFAVKYINKYHGTYLHRGVDETLTAEGGTPVAGKTFTYQADYIEKDLLTLMTTKSLTTGVIDRLGGKNQGASFTAELTFNDAAKTITIASPSGDASLHGTGTFVLADDSKADVWGNKGHLTLYLDYYYKVGAEFHHAKDTLVYRDNNMQYEQYTITLTN